MNEPTGGWKTQTYYRVKVSLYKGNCPHESIFYSGFLNEVGETPGGYSCFLNPTYEGIVPYQPEKATMTSIEELFTKGDY